MDKLIVLVPCYNEAENLAALVKRWRTQAPQLAREGYVFQLLIVDDGSRDRTCEIAQGLCERYPEITLVSHGENLGLGGALNTGINWFLSHARPGDVCAVMDGDNTHDPCYIHRLLEQLRSGVDCAIASRYCGASEVYGVPGYRRLLSDGARLFYRVVLGVPGVRDYTCGYRAYRYCALRLAKKRFSDQLITQKTFSCMMELLYKLALCGCVFAEVPFTLRYDRKGGKSKLNIMRTVGTSVSTALALRLKAHTYKTVGKTTERRERV